MGGELGTLVFSIEETSVSGAKSPLGASLMGAPMQFGPEAMTFAQPVQLSFPLPSDTSQDYMLARLDRETDAWVLVPSLVVESDPDRLFAHANHLSTWGLFGVPRDERAANPVRWTSRSGASSMARRELCPEPSLWERRWR